jgi:hypothetical protein
MDDNRSGLLVERIRTGTGWLLGLEATEGSLYENSWAGLLGWLAFVGIRKKLASGLQVLRSIGFN